MRHHAQSLPQFVTQIAYHTEGKNFKKIVKKVHVTEIPSSANIKSSHALYKVKILDDKSVTMKSRTAPHGNKDKERDIVKSDSAVCPPFETCAILSITGSFK